MIRKISVGFTAGALGALVISLLFWALGDGGWLARFHINLHPALTPGWLYGRICWGGLWGLLFILPVLKSRSLAKGLLLSLFPSLFALFFFLPQGPSGLLGLKAGTLTPVLVLGLNGIWGIVAAIWYRNGAK